MLDFASFHHFTIHSLVVRLSNERKWQAQSAHQSENKVLEYIFKVTTDENGKTIIGGMTEILEYIFTLNVEENCKISEEGMRKNRTEYPNMTVYVKTINGKQSVSNITDNKKQQEYWR